jgi:hypothetical protein
VWKFCQNVELVNLEPGEERGEDRSKNSGSNRRIEIRSFIRQVLEQQKTQLAGLQSPYVFLNHRNRPVNQVTIREVWVTAMRRSGLPFRRMYET